MTLLALFLLGTLTGNELAIGRFVHPALTRLPDTIHAAVAQALARIYGKVGPPWYAATLLFLILAAVRAPAGHAARTFFIAAVALLIASLVLTLTTLVPINSRVAAWDLQALPEHWKTDRARWDTLHSLRILLLAVSFAALAWGATHP